MKCQKLFFLLLFVGGAQAQTDVAVPLEEYKSLFRERIERELREQPKTPDLHTIEQAEYIVHLDSSRVEGEVQLRGKVVSGKPPAFKVLGREVAVTEVVETSGGALLSDGDGAPAFLAEPGAPEFVVHLRFSILTTEDAGMRAARFAIARSVRSALTVNVGDGLLLAEAPGIVAGDGAYHLAAADAITLRFFDRENVAAAAMVEVDTLAEITAQKGRHLVRLWMLPKRSMQAPVVVVAPTGAQYVGASLPADAIAKNADGLYNVALRAPDAGPAYVEFLLEEQPLENAPLTLPTIEANRGQQGRFVVQEPSDGEVAVSGDGLMQNLPIDRLGDALASVVPRQTAFMSVPGAPELKLSLRQFEPADAMSTVLAVQQLFTVIEENGTSLSTLILELPKDWGRRLRLDAVPGAQIWSLSVNGAAKQVLMGEDGAWLIPLEPGVASKVAISFLTHSEKLGLLGKVPVVVPKTGLASQSLHVGVALPARLMLTGIEGGLSTVNGASWEAPLEFTGRKYYFSRAFYKGEGSAIVVAYKEPVDRLAATKEVTE
jgi:hypothetical protein